MDSCHRRSSFMRRRLNCISALAVAALVLSGCMLGGSSEVDEVTDAVIESNSLSRLAVINGDEAVEAPVTRDCLLGEFREIGPPGSCEEMSVELPTIEVEPGDTLEFVTGTESGGVYAILNDTGDGHESAEVVDEEDRRRYLLTIPQDKPIGAEISIGVGPTTTDSGSLNFGIATE